MDTIYLLPGEERCIDFRDANGIDVAAIRLDPQILFTVLRAHQLQQKTLRIPTPSEFAGSISSYLCAQRLVETAFHFLRLQTGFFLQSSADHFQIVQRRCLLHSGHKILCSSCTRSPITMGLDKKPFMPLSSALRRSSSKALAVMAMIGSFPSAGSSSARIFRVAV